MFWQTDAVVEIVALFKHADIFLQFSFNSLIQRVRREEMSVKTLNVHACVHVHGQNWMSKSCMVEVRGILQRKFRSQS